MTLLATTAIICPGLSGADDPSLLPKYGLLPKTASQQAADANFMAAIDEEYRGDRSKASTELAARGWQFLAAQNFADAMRRFNQAWLLNNNNGTALWGMAAIQASSGEFGDSLKLFAEAERFVGGELNFAADYAKALGMVGTQLGDEALLKDAFERFERVHQKAPQNADNLQNWAITLFITERFSEAWAKVKLIEATPDKDVLDPSFVAALQARMPRPQD